MPKICRCLVILLLTPHVACLSAGTWAAGDSGGVESSSGDIPMEPKELADSADSADSAEPSDDLPLADAYPCEPSRQLCLGDEDCLELKACVDDAECTSRPCVTECKCELQTSDTAVKLFNGWIFCEISLMDCEDKRPPTFNDVIECIEVCGMCNPGCEEVCIQEKGGSEWETWEDCVAAGP